MSWGVMTEQWGWGTLAEGWRKGPWTAEEDSLLVEYVKLHGEGRWNSVARLAGLKRNGKSCRLRWVNYLRPDLKRGQITPHEESIILELHARWGNRWSTIARSLPGRTDNEIKNYWRTHFKQKGKSSSDKSKTHLQRKQQFQQQQQQQKQSQTDVEKIMKFLGETTINRATTPTQDMTTFIHSVPIEEQPNFLYSVFNGYPTLPEAPGEDIIWDGFLNMENVTNESSSILAASNQATATPFYYY